MQVVSINLDKLDKVQTDKIKTDKNGTRWITLVIKTSREVDKFGNDLNVSLSQSKEEREQRIAPTYIGSGKNYDKK